MLIKHFFSLLLQQIYFHGIRGIGVVLLSAIFTGQVIVAEYAHHIRYLMHDLTFVPPFATAMIVTQFGPMLACLLMVAVSGSAIASETGILRATEQWDALKVENISVARFYIFPRIIACTLVCMGLTILNMGGEMCTTLLMSPSLLDLSIAKYGESMFDFVTLTDLVQGICKSVIFGVTYPIIAIVMGRRSVATSASIGYTSTKAVVWGVCAIIVEDFVISYVFSLWRS